MCWKNNKSMGASLMNRGEALGKPRVGRVGYINCFPIFYPLEKGLIKLSAQIVADHPSNLNSLFAAGDIEVTAVSSIAYAHQCSSCVVLPDLAIASDGAVWSVALLSRVPLSQLKGERVSLTPYSATSIALLQILLSRFYEVEVEYFYRPQGVSPWWGEPKATLVIGDEALKTIYRYLEEDELCANQKCYVYDLGAEWKKFTGKQMVFALWVVRRDFMEQHPVLLRETWLALQEAKSWSSRHRRFIAEQAQSLIRIPAEIMEDYFRHIKYELYLNGLHQFFEYAWHCGVLDSQVQAEVWRDPVVEPVKHG
jgi:chorismate dehydratase